MGLRLFLVGALALAFALAGCSKKKEESYPGYVAARDDDAEMNGAMAHARETLDVFLAVLRAPSPAQHEMAIKARFTDGAHVEHMWVAPVAWDGSAFRGRLNDAPFQLASPKRGDAVVVDRDQVSDWMYVEDGKLHGGFTLRVMRARLPPEQQRAVEKDLGYTFAD